MSRFIYERFAFQDGRIPAVDNVIRRLIQFACEPMAAVDCMGDRAGGEGVADAIDAAHSRSLPVIPAIQQCIVEFAAAKARADDDQGLAGNSILPAREQICANPVT